jgi:fructokinase
MILCCGDALIDFLPVVTADGVPAFRPVVGGSVHNVAIALGRLGVPTGFFSGISKDFFGEQIVESFTASGVSLTHAPRFDWHTTLAFVRMENGHPRYAFIDDAAAGRMLSIADLPEIGPEISALHFGSIHLIRDPVAGAMEVLAARGGRDRLVSYDPNIRPSLITDRRDFLKRVRGFGQLADIIKLSDEDFAWFADGSSFEDAARSWLNAGSKLVILTEGAAGARALSQHHAWHVPGVTAKVVDTVGAGDTFTAGVLTSLHRAGALSKSALINPAPQLIDDALRFAARAAAITVSRAGADPPWQRELA